MALTQAVIVVCIVALTGVLISTLLALRKTAIRAESVLALLEREIQPMASQVESMAAELRTLSQHATRELDRVAVVVTRVEDVTSKVARLVGALAGSPRSVSWPAPPSESRRGSQSLSGGYETSHRATSTALRGSQGRRSDGG